MIRKNNMDMLPKEIRGALSYTKTSEAAGNKQVLRNEKKAQHDMCYNIRGHRI